MTNYIVLGLLLSFTQFTNAMFRGLNATNKQFLPLSPSYLPLSIILLLLTVLINLSIFFKQPFHVRRMVGGLFSKAIRCNSGKAFTAARRYNSGKSVYSSSDATIINTLSNLL